MDVEVGQFWLRLLDALNDFANGRILIEEYRQRLQALQSAIGEERLGFHATTPLAFVPLSSALTGCLSEIHSDVIQDEGNPLETARWLFNHYFELFVLQKKTYTEPAPAGILGGADQHPVHVALLPEPVQQFLEFAEDILEGQPLLEPLAIRRLHQLYARLRPDTLAGILCVEALQVLLPWLAEGLIHEDHLAVFEQKPRPLDSDTRRDFEHWVQRLRGERKFTTRLRYYQNVILVRIE